MLNLVALGLLIAEMCVFLYRQTEGQIGRQSSVNSPSDPVHQSIHFMVSATLSSACDIHLSE